jgi:hypothetical protein
MAADKPNWDAPPLSADDEALIDAYSTVGRPLDELPYTEDFERLLDLLKRPRNRDEMQFVFRRLLTLRKRGLLPHVFMPV